MRFQTKYLAAGCIAFSALILTACEKDETKNDSDTGVATEYYKGQRESDDIFAALNAAAQDNSVMRPDEDFDVTSTLLPECATVTVDTVGSTKSIMIDFGTTGCLCDDWDGKTRKGKITAQWSGKYRQPGTVIQVSTQDYYVNGNKHEFNKTVKNDGLNDESHLSYTVNITLAKITYADGTVTQWTSSRTREWSEGEATLTPYDDVYHITGSASGTSAAGEDFSVNITSPLEVALSCNWVREGTMVITPQGKPARTLDFGNGNCDNNATVEINGTVYNINL
ncbi:MAG TPA: hypothetical protein VEY71_11965 [Chitinophagales bacterium]|nr:hypothetical protein [Chitinophagales bacterium]